jgi:hypothetical protein|tara:strand:- start:568 stop:768 length:201 start_codon:yes stop_codon:yes gene_type:complete
MLAYKLTAIKAAVVKMNYNALKNEAAVVADRMGKYSKADRTMDKYQELSTAWKILRKEMEVKYANK